MRTAIMKIVQKVARQALAFGAAETSKTFTFRKSGLLKHITSIASDPTNVITYGISIADADGATVYSVATLARNATTNTTGLLVPLCDEEYTVTVTLSGVPGVSGIEIKVTLLVER